MTALGRQVGAFCICLGVLCGCATVASGQAITVRSGEHASFTRLVLEIGENRTFDLTQDEGRASVTFDPSITAFELSNVFDLVPRDRLAELTVVDGELVLTLACNCPVTASRFQERFVVVDILDPEDDPPRARPEDSAAASAEDIAAARRIAAAEAVPDLVDVLRGGTQDSTPAPERDPAQDQEETGAGLAPAEAAGPDVVSIDNATVLMAEQLARAASSGFLDIAPGQAFGEANPVARQGRLMDALTMAMPGSPAMPLRAETAADAALGQPGNGLQQTDRLVCNPGYAEVFDWSPEIGFDEDLGRLRRALYDDRGALREEGVRDLAQHYIFNGFGAEGAFWLDQLNTPPDHLRVLTALVDGAPGPHFDPLNGADPCSEAALFWRYLDESGPPSLTIEQVNAIQRLAVSLPDPLRDYLTPDIARRLSADGHTNAAFNLRDMLERSGRASAATLLHLDLDLGIAPETTQAQTRRNLAVALRDDATDAPRAMTQALRFDRDTGVTAPPVRLEAAAALLRETGPTAEGMELWRELVLALVDAGNMDEALAYLSDPSVDDATYNRTLTGVFSNRIAEQDIASLILLAHGFGRDWTETGSDAGRARVGAMALLRSEGFPEAADRLRGGRQALILPARPSTDPTSEDILHDAWLSADWNRIATLTDGAHRDVAARMGSYSTGINPPPADNLPSLQATVADSRALRETIRSILDTPSPVDNAGRP